MWSVPCRSFDAGRLIADCQPCATIYPYPVVCTSEPPCSLAMFCPRVFALEALGLGRASPRGEALRSCGPGSIRNTWGPDHHHRHGSSIGRAATRGGTRCRCESWRSFIRRIDGPLVAGGHSQPPRRGRSRSVRCGWRLASVRRPKLIPSWPAWPIALPQVGARSYLRLTGSSPYRPPARGTGGRPSDHLPVWGADRAPAARRLSGGARRCAALHGLAAAGSASRRDSSLETFGPRTWWRGEI